MSDTLFIGYIRHPGCKRWKSVTPPLHETAARDRLMIEANKHRISDTTLCMVGDDPNVRRRVRR